MNTEEAKKEIQDTLTKKLSDIADEIVKNLGETEESQKSDDKDETQKSQTTETEESSQECDDKGETQNSQETENSDNEILKQLQALSEQFTGINKRLDKMENPDAELNKRKDEIVSKATKLAKEMGINPEDVDIDFKITEKKKGNQDTNKSQDDFSKKQKEETNSGDLEKELENASDEERKEALGTYFKSILQ